LPPECVLDYGAAGLPRAVVTPTTARSGGRVILPHGRPPRVDESAAPRYIMYHCMGVSPTCVPKPARGGASAGDTGGDGDAAPALGDVRDVRPAPRGAAAAAKAKAAARIADGSVPSKSHKRVNKKSCIVSIRLDFLANGNEATLKYTGGAVGWEHLFGEHHEPERAARGLGVSLVSRALLPEAQPEKLIRDLQRTDGLLDFGQVAGAHLRQVVSENANLRSQLQNVRAAFQRRARAITYVRSV